MSKPGVSGQAARRRTEKGEDQVEAWSECKEEKYVSYKPYYNKPIIGFILDAGQSTSLEPQGDGDDGDCEADGG